MVCGPPPLPERLPARGITGHHIGIAIIDSCWLTGHREYAGRLRSYDEVDVVPGDTARWHGIALASIAAGKTVGVAVEADLYFVGLGMNWAAHYALACQDNPSMTPERFLGKQAGHGSASYRLV